MRELREPLRIKFDRGEGGLRTDWDFWARSGPEVEDEDGVMDCKALEIAWKVDLRVNVGRLIVVGDNARGRKVRVETDGGKVGDLERSFVVPSLEDGRKGATGGRGGADLLRLSTFFSWAH